MASYGEMRELTFLSRYCLPAHQLVDPRASLGADPHSSITNCNVSVDHLKTNCCNHAPNEPKLFHPLEEQHLIAVSPTTSTIVSAIMAIESTSSPDAAMAPRRVEECVEMLIPQEGFGYQRKDYSPSHVTVATTESLSWDNRLSESAPVKKLTTSTQRTAEMNDNLLWPLYTAFYSFIVFQKPNGAAVAKGAKQVFLQRLIATQHQLASDLLPLFDGEHQVSVEAYRLDPKRRFFLS
ncbi:hypothetical protein PROFUN_15452 [Planoprotostelium fungivorum]|uniref:Uncharacterized protein n=1 Tax=Planoprotostelium fungivorum TaxID=1890364 RepID=A0A2P6MW34_9EUKA|nr:hypothetical protein PROFUN_15452 [Planoprotostelium fungivorum]